MQNIKFKSGRQAFLSAARGVLRSLRFAVAFILLWLRGFFLLATRGLAGLAGAAFLVVLLVRFVGSKSVDGVLDAYWPILALSFGSFALGLLYDLLLLALVPGDELELFQ